ncbi:hypothetical protein [Pilimelia terevasa]|uniref:hypothetical protein n=1 Tax=Pilimelia terevasa TaxID=53372 RepID=UPI0016632697|nr:hypothetical protein [Pilimelia terevasa]
MNLWVLWGVCAVLGLVVLGLAAWSVLRRLGPLGAAVRALTARSAQAEALQAKVEALMVRVAEMEARAADGGRPGPRRGADAA